MKKVKSKKLQIFLFISALGLISIFGWLATVTTNDDTKTSVRYEILTNKKQYQHQQTKCLINNENITCVKWFDKYYIPFDFLSRKFDVNIFDITNRSHNKDNSIAFLSYTLVAE